MGTTVLFKPTVVQKRALELLKSGAKHILLFGVSRSGKTTGLVMAILYRAKDARSSALRETLLPWLDNTIGETGYPCLAHESMVTLFKGSEIWIGRVGDVVYVAADYGAFNMTTQSFNEEVTARGWLDCAEGCGYPVYCDPAAGNGYRRLAAG